MFAKEKKDDLKDSPEELLLEYVRLVKVDDIQNFLDIDATNTIELRDQIESNIK